MGAPPRRPPLPWLKPALLTGGLFPFAVVVFRAARGELGANPIATALNQFGLLALLFLLASLACTPLQALVGWTWPMRVRRMLGVFAFFYATTHLLTYVGVDQGFDGEVLWRDVTRRPFIIAGMGAWLLLLPLALTSTNASVRRLGHTRWQLLHRLAYPAAVLAVLHFIWRVKKDLTEPLVYAAVLLVLLLVRAVLLARRRLSA